MPRHSAGGCPPLGICHLFTWGLAIKERGVGRKKSTHQLVLAGTGTVMCALRGKSAGGIMEKIEGPESAKWTHKCECENGKTNGNVDGLCAFAALAIPGIIQGGGRMWRGK